MHYTMPAPGLQEIAGAQTARRGLAIVTLSPQPFSSGEAHIMRARWQALFAACIGIGAVVSATGIVHSGEGGKKVAPRVFELRTYHVHPGKMKALHDRFRDHTCKLFTKHGMTMVGFWSPTDPKEAEKKMVYLMAYPSRDAADKAWAAFRDDPDWGKAKAESEKGGPIVARVESVFLDPTDYSQLK
jgi:hypothetical protein